MEGAANSVNCVCCGRNWQCIMASDMALLWRGLAVLFMSSPLSKACLKV